jgi:CheY-like chemotaxis protein
MRGRFAEWSSKPFGRFNLSFLPSYSGPVRSFPIPTSKVSRDRRPTVLLADDDAGMLKAISRTLATEFEVVATVTNGRQALDTVPRLDPDVVVLDISMPDLNGFQTAEELTRLGSRARIVFLTMHQDDDFVAKAIRCGAAGYVPKMAAWSDLVPALHHAIGGRQYLPSFTPLVMTNTDAHAVQFRERDNCWLDGVADVLSRALERGDTVATVFLESNRETLGLRMKERGWNLADATEQGRYLVFDAEEAATQVMRGGWPDVDSIRELVAVLERARTASAAGALSHLTIVGEMAVVLWRHGKPEAALELARLWNEQTRSLPILTICTYPMDCLHHESLAAFGVGICTHHSVISQSVES